MAFARLLRNTGFHCVFKDLPCKKRRLFAVDRGRAGFYGAPRFAAGVAARTLVFVP